MKQKAEAGDATERWNLGTMYDTGEGIPKDYTKALKWFRMAAEQGLAPSQYSVGNMYYNGRGVSKDYAKAAIWYRVSANQGFVLAQYFLGLMYEYGKGVPRNYTKAVQWYRKAANQGLASARYNLGFMYTTGEGVPKDEIEGLAWFYIVAASEQKDAIHNERILEAKLGSRMALLAQQRSKELLKGIAAAKKAKANRSSSNSSSEVAQSSTAKPELKATGSGVIVSANGVILTAAHVVAGADWCESPLAARFFPQKCWRSIPKMIWRFFSARETSRRSLAHPLAASNWAKPFSPSASPISKFKGSARKSPKAKSIAWTECGTTRACGRSAFRCNREIRADRFSIPPEISSASSSQNSMPSKSRI